MILSGLNSYNRVYPYTKYFVTLSNLNARPLALGGAFFSAEDDIASIHYNPSTVLLYSADRKAKFTFFVNPILPFVSMKNPEYFGKKNGARNIFDSFKYFIKGVIYSRESVILGVLFHEESLYNIKQSEKFFSPENFRYNNYSTFIVNIKLAKRMSFGVNGTSYSQIAPDGRVIKGKWGTSYGIFMQPGSNYSIGIAYIDMPSGFSEYRKRMERISDETINAGISYKFRNHTTLYFDIRNINEETQTPDKEIHFGMENNYIKHFSLRCGYFHSKKTETTEKKDVYSLGFGLVDFNNFCNIENRFTHNNFAFNYCAIFEKYYDNEYIVWHFLSLNIRI